MGVATCQTIWFHTSHSSWNKRRRKNKKITKFCWQKRSRACVHITFIIVSFVDVVVVVVPSPFFEVVHGNSYFSFFRLAHNHKSRTTSAHVERTQRRREFLRAVWLRSGVTQDTVEVTLYRLDMCARGASPLAYLWEEGKQHRPRNEKTTPEVFSSHIQIACLNRPLLYAYPFTLFDMGAHVCGSPKQCHVQFVLWKHFFFLVFLFFFFPLHNNILYRRETHSRKSSEFVSLTPWMVSRRIFVFSICFVE